MAASNQTGPAKPRRKIFTALLNFAPNSLYRAQVRSENMNPGMTEGPAWTVQTARSVYNIDRWGANYFDINDDGHVVARPLQENGATVDITDVLEEAKGRGLRFPLLIRFQDILRHRVESINLAFRNSIAEFNYQGKYRGVFPIKVNQPVSYTHLRAHETRHDL